MYELEQLNEFLRHSNYIEGEYDDVAFDDAYLAWRFLEMQESLTWENILETHRRLMWRKNARIAGKIRDCQVTVGGHFPPAPEVVGYHLASWIQNLGDVKSEGAITQAHIEFEKIHPFEDGNGRVGRIIMNWQRVKNGLPLLIIHEGDEQMKYYKWFRR